MPTAVEVWSPATGPPGIPQYYAFVTTTLKPILKSGKASTYTQTFFIIIFSLQYHVHLGILKRL